jgi:hypothetical protein
MHIYVRASIILAFMELGMKYQSKGACLNVKELVSEWGIIKEMFSITLRFFEVLAEDGYLLQSTKDRNEFQVI